MDQQTIWTHGTGIRCGPFSRSPQRPIDLPDGLGQSDRHFFKNAVGRAFNIENKGGDELEIDLYEEIGFWGVEASAFRNQIKDFKGSTINLKINSPGGDVFDGIAMHNDLVEHPAQVKVTVTGLAASAASIVAMAADEIEMGSASFLMIHNAWTIGMGDRHDFADLSGMLGKIDHALAQVYSRRTGKSAKAIQELMDAETWMDPADAINDGFADSEVGTDSDGAQAKFDLSCFKNTPKNLSAEVIQFTPKTKRDFETVLRDAGCSRVAAKAKVAKMFVDGDEEDGQGQRDADADQKNWAALARLATIMENAT